VAPSPTTLLPPELRAAPSSRILVETSFHQFHAQAEDRRAQFSCRLTLDRKDGVFTMGACFTAPEVRSVGPIADWRSRAAVLGLLEHFSAPYFLQNITQLLYETRLADDPTFAGPFGMPPGMYAPLGPWDLLRTATHPDVAVEASIHTPFSRAPYDLAAADFLRSLWCLDIRQVAVVLPDSARIISRHEFDRHQQRREYAPAAAH
jgi:hypothetical protein